MYKIDYDSNINKIAIYLPWTQEFVSTARNIPTSLWDVTNKRWLIEPIYADYVNQQFFEPLTRTTAFLDLLQSQNQSNEAKSKQLQKIFDTINLDQVFGVTTLFDHQKEGVLHILKNTRSLLAMDMGTGKTKTSLVAAGFLGKPIHVIAPPSLRNNWFEEAKSVNIPIDQFISACSIPTSKSPTDITVIADEVHYYQNIKSNRTKNFLNYTNNIENLICLSGTPIKNGRPENIYPILLALKHPIAFSKEYFYIRFCEGKKANYRWYSKGASNLKELHQIISPIMFRKTKEECLTLPPKLRIIQQIEPNTQERDEFNETFLRLREKYFDRIRKKIISSNNDHLVMLSQIRHAASKAKVSAVVEIVEELLDEGKNPVVFVAYEESATKLKEKLSTMGNIGILHGKIDIKERNKTIADFQNGSLDVLVSTFGVGGVGINLTRSDYVILMDRPWTSGDALQAEDRVHRIGTKEAVTAIWLQHHEIDKRIDRLLIEKQKNINEVLEGVRDTLEFTFDVRDRAKELLEEIF